MTQIKLLPAKIPRQDSYGRRDQMMLCLVLITVAPLLKVASPIGDCLTLMNSEHFQTAQIPSEVVHAKSVQKRDAFPAVAGTALAIHVEL